MRLFGQTTDLSERDGIREKPDDQKQRMAFDSLQHAQTEYQANDQVRHDP